MDEESHLIVFSFNYSHMKPLFFLWLITFGSLNTAFSQSQIYREVLVFAPEGFSEKLEKQVKILKSDSKGLQERDIKLSVYRITSKTLTRYKNLNLSKQNFTFILIGKDGGEKFRSTEVVSLVKLYSLIDAMPMRKYEMRKQ
ncbi:DUF4174 domain-containing protein [Pedobacter cryophilus]|uniref:DUF4174 domain-containing protein n=2 Tax=Pedobacter cryophilus TaxID=2571271 RepID=A0A4U1C7N3_9SPHI|nr:DUF4174 domain-containing protein [Pedobacter cryophilus]